MQKIGAANSVNFKGLIGLKNPDKSKNDYVYINTDNIIQIRPGDYWDGKESKDDPLTLITYNHGPLDYDQYNTETYETRYYKHDTDSVLKAYSKALKDGIAVVE